MYKAMIHPVIRIFLVLIILISYSCGNETVKETKYSEFEELATAFKQVPSEYRPVPFWVWNGEVSESFIDEQLEAFAENGFGGVFIHPRYGLITEYGGEEWYELVEYAHKKARKLGLVIWLYDENSFPSGFGGGLVPASMPESYNQGHALLLHKAGVLLPDSTKNFQFILELTDSVRDISAEKVKYLGKRGKYELWENINYPVRDWYAGYSYVDLLMPGVTEKFIEVTMTGYKEKLGNSFGKSVPGVFTDEPNIAPQGDPALIRWTPDLLDRFQERWGYDLKPYLSLLVENKEGAGKIRHNYYQLLLELFIERWSIPWYEYTEANGLKWTGHYWEHGWPSPHHGPDNMAMYAYHQLPGIDMLFNAWEDRPDQFGNIRAVKELNSVGNQLGRKRKLSETFGASGWELTFEEMKRNGDWEYVMGVNMLNQHLAYQTLMGDRKHDFPQSISYHAPYWEEYKAQNDYFGRLSLALSSGEQYSSILVLEPTTTTWMNYATGEENKELERIGESFDRLLMTLESEHIEYDLGSEYIIKEYGKIKEQQFVVGERSYNYLVIPTAMTNMNRETADLLEDYLKNEGIVVALCQPPAYIDGERNNKVTDLAQEYSDQWFTMGSCDDPRLISYLRDESLLFVDKSGGDIYHMRRYLDDGELLFVVNSSMDETAYTRIYTRGKDLVKLDLESGEIYSYPCVVSSDAMSMDLELHPAGSILLFISDKELSYPVNPLARWNTRDSDLLISPINTALREDNVLTLDYCSLIVGEDTIPEDYYYTQQERAFKYHGFDKNPWVSASQFKQELVERDTFPEGTGYTAVFQVTVDSSYTGSKLELVVERPGLYTVSLNGQELSLEEDDWWLDKSFGVFNVTGMLKAGENEVSVRSSPMSVFAELEPVYLKGDFNLESMEKGFKLVSSEDLGLGSWKDQGLPFYSGEITYTAHFNMGKTLPAKVVLGDWYGTLAKVTVNGKDAGQVYTKPWELRIDHFLQTGENVIEITVYGSLKNLLGPHHNVTSRGIVTPWSFKYAPSQQVAGKDYDLIDYGLFEAFRVMVLREKH